MRLLVEEPQLRVRWIEQPVEDSQPGRISVVCDPHVTVLLAVELVEVPDEVCIRKIALGQ